VTRISFAIGTAVAALSTMQALAADLGRFPPAAPVYRSAALVPVYNWTGCYLGAQLGGAWADNHANGQFAGFAFNENNSAAAVLVGGQVGCDLQFARNWVIGAQIDGAWTNLTATQGLAGSQAVPGVGTLALSGSLNLKANVIATGTGRIGYAANFGDIAGLLYLKGGAAFVNLDSSNFGAQATLTTGGTSTSGAVDFSAPSSNRWGWTIGVGTEWAVAENWSIVGEWNFLDFGTQTLTFTDPNLGSSQVNVRQHINELKLGINYRFGDRIPAQYPY
jgi:outer membrane immunogenic protein